MAYNTRYYFKFLATNGTEYTINIKEKDYVGTATQRALGQAPVLKREANECIYGSSLELYAECLTDGEFSVLYTSDPKQFLAEVVAGSVTIWQGYITPELYSEPDIAPPYDVQIIATDGLGELKLHSFELEGQHTLQVILNYILQYTGLSYTISKITSLAVDLPTEVAAKDVLSSVKVDFTNMVGKTCYDVLQSILASLHAVLFCHYGEWVLARETDVVENNSYIAGWDSAGVAKNFTVASYGQLGVKAWWPVGNLSTAIIPACKKVTVAASNEYKLAVIDNDSWTYTGGAYYDSTLGGHKLPTQGAAMRQTAVFSNYIDYNLVLAITARNLGESIYAAKLGIKVTKTYVSGGTTQTTYLAYREQDGTTTLVWQNNTANVSAVIAAPHYSDGQASATECEFTLPLYYFNEENYDLANSLTIELYNLNGEFEQVVYSCGLRKAETGAGFKDVILLNNGAREEAKEIDMALVPAINGSATNGIEAFLCGLPMVGSQRVAAWNTRSFTSLDTLAIMARDYALSSALPRAKVTGVLNKPSTQRVPIAFKDSNGIVYWLYTYEWDLYNDELTIELHSLPAATIDIEAEAIRSIDATGKTASGSSSSGGGGGAAASGVTRVGVSSNIDGLNVSGSPVTSSGVIALSLEAGYELPQTGRILHNDGSANAILKVVAVSEYPSVEESGTLYIKI